MRLPTRLWREEDGQVLYLTLVMMLCLVLFTLILVNAIYLALAKVRAQNAADNLAISAATLKARVLNETVNMNGILYGGVSRLGTASQKLPYAESLEQWIGFAAMSFALAEMGRVVVEHNRTIDARLERIAVENGLDKTKAKVKISNVDISLLDFNQSWELIEVVVPPLTGVPMLTAIEPAGSWDVQSRVEWRTKDEVIGGKWLNTVLPDVVTRARAQIFDEGPLPTSWAHIWRVRLAQPDEAEDQRLSRD